MTQAGAKGPAAPAKPAAVPAAKATSPAAPAVAPKPAATVVMHGAPPKPPAAPPAQTPAAAGVAPRKGPPPLRAESSPDLVTKPLEPMRPRFETSPGVGHAAAPAAESPRAPAVGALSREDVEGMIRRGVADGVAAVLGETQRLIHALERRIDDLERRPVAPAVAPAPPMVQTAPLPARPLAAAPVDRPQAYAPAPASMIPVTQGSLAPSVPHAPILDVKAIEHDVKVDVDSALDGRRRKRNLAIVITLFIVVVFGGLFALLAESYAPHH